MRIFLHYTHVRVVGSCKASETFTVEVPELQDGFFDMPQLRCCLCHTQPQIMRIDVEPGKVEIHKASPDGAGRIKAICKSEGFQLAERWKNVTCPECLAYAPPPFYAKSTVEKEQWVQPNMEVQCACSSLPHFCYRHHCTPGECHIGRTEESDKEKWI